MRFRVLRGFCLGSGVDVHPGHELELSETQARVYLQQGRLAPLPEEAPPAAPVADAPAPAASPDTTSVPPGSPPAAVHQDPVPTTRGRGHARG